MIGKWKLSTHKLCQFLRQTLSTKTLRFLESLKSLLQDENFNASYWRIMESMMCILQNKWQVSLIWKLQYFFFSISLEVGYEKNLVEGREIIYTGFL